MRKPAKSKKKKKMKQTYSNKRQPVEQTFDQALKCATQVKLGWIPTFHVE